MVFKKGAVLFENAPFLKRKIINLLFKIQKKNLQIVLSFSLRIHFFVNMDFSFFSVGFMAYEEIFSTYLLQKIIFSSFNQIKNKNY